MRILVVDDDFIALSLIEAALAMYGFSNVTKASSAQDAVQLLKEAPNAFDCILLDYRMPDVDGAQLCVQIRRFPRYRSTPIIFVTAASDRSSINTVYSVGAIDYVSKPIDPQEIAIRVSIAEKLALEAQEKAKVGMKSSDAPNRSEPFPYFDIKDPVPIFHVNGVVGRIAMNNYIQAIGQGQHDDFAVSAIGINGFEDIHDSVSPAIAYAIISEIAKTISDSLKRNETLICYNGYGEFICVTKNTDLSENVGQARRINSRIARMKLATDDGTPLSATVSIGKAVSSHSYLKPEPEDMISEALSTAGIPDYVFRSTASAGAGLRECSSPLLNL